MSKPYETVSQIMAERDQLRAELAALKAGQGVAVAPYGYLREVDGNVQLSIGALRPADRSGGIATPWAAIFAAPPASADAVLVQRELLERVLDPETSDEWSKACRELRSLLVRQGSSHE